MTDQDFGNRDPFGGRVLKQRFRLDERIGTGSMGAVYRAWDLRIERCCAVKLLRPDLTKQSAIVVRFLDEAKIISRLYHPNIVEMIEFGEDHDGILFFVMEFLSGQDLHTLLQRESQLSPQRTIDIVRQVGSALHSMHLANVVHRDIKPRNVFIVQDESSKSPTAKVIDFGLSKWLDGQDRASDGLLIGTPEYLPPEAWSGQSRFVDARADQWALGVMTYRMLTGRLPFESRDDPAALAYEIRTRNPRSMRDLSPDIPEHVEQAVARALAKEKEHRFASVCEFVRELSRLPLTMPLITSPARPLDTLLKRETSFPFPMLHSTLLHTQPVPPPLERDELITTQLLAQVPADPEPVTRMAPVQSASSQDQLTALRRLPSARTKKPARHWAVPSWTPWLVTAALLGWNVRGLRLEPRNVEGVSTEHRVSPMIQNSPVATEGGSVAPGVLADSPLSRTEKPIREELMRDPSPVSEPTNSGRHPHPVVVPHIGAPTPSGSVKHGASPKRSANQGTAKTWRG